MPCRLSLVLLSALCLTGSLRAQPAAMTDWPLFGGTPGRNMVNLTAKNLPIEWSVEADKKKNVKWMKPVGNVAYGGPVVAGGRVFVGTNNAVPRDPKVKGDKSVLMCFKEDTGDFLWQNTHEPGEGAVFNDVQKLGLLSTPVVDGKYIYYVLPQSIVICADVENGKIAWQYDMAKKLEVIPYHCSNCSPLIHGDLLYLVTGKGIDPDTSTVRPDKSPSFIALNKKSGELAWKNDLPGDKVIEGQWSNPALAVINGKAQIIFPGGDAGLYSFEAEKGEPIWQFRCFAKNAKEKEKNYFVSTPVVHDNKVYVGMGVAPELGTVPRFSYFLCVDATRKGDVSPTSLDPKAEQGKDSALLWSFGGPMVPAPKTGKAVWFKSTISTAAVYNGLVFIPEIAGYMHCLDAVTGKEVWQYDLKDNIWGSAYCADGKVYLGIEGGEVNIFQASREMKILGKADMDDNYHGTPVVANGVLYIATKTKLFAISAK